MTRRRPWTRCFSGWWSLQGVSGPPRRDGGPPGGRPLASAHQTAHGIHQLGGLLVALLRGVGADHAGVGVVVEEPERDLVQCRPRRRDLRQYVDAVAVL